MMARLSGAKGGERSAAFYTIGHWSHGAFFGGFRIVPAAMIITQAIDVRFAIRRACPRVGITSAAAGAMRIRITFDARRTLAMRLRRPARHIAADFVAARIRHGIARARTALRIFNAPHAFRRGCSLSPAIRSISATTIATQAATFVLRAGLANAAQTEATVSAIGILAAFRARRADRTRQTEWISRHLHAIDHHAVEREAIRATIATTRRRIVFGQCRHTATHGQIADATFALQIRRAFHTKRLTIRLERRAIHLRSELTIRATIARSSRT